MKKYILLPILGLMLVYGCGKKEEVKENKDEKFCIDKDLKEKITIEPVQKRAVSESINLTGNITITAIILFSLTALYKEL